MEEYLKTQKRFSHLFYPVRRDDLINEYQARINAYWEKVWKTELK